MEGTYRDPNSGACLLVESACVSGEVFDFEKEECVDVSSICGDGYTWVAGQAGCVSNDLLREPDYREGSGENDPAFGDEFEWLHPPAIGEKTTFAGTIDVPRDKNDDGLLDPDYDLWLFEVDEPTLLRVRADAFGGATSGFSLIAIVPDIGWMRFAIATTSRDVTRDVFLPAAGLYAFYMTDALHYLAGQLGPFHGGGDMGYFVELERLPIPEPTPLSLTDEELAQGGVWPIEAPEEGSMLSFYSVSVEPQSMYFFSIRPQGGLLWEQLIVSGEGKLFAADEDGYAHGFVEGDELFMVADYAFNFDHAPRSYEIMITRHPSTWLGADILDVSHDQPEYTRDENWLPYAVYGFEAEQNDIFTVHLESSTGHTCFDVRDAQLTGTFQRLNCDVHLGATVHKTEVTVIAPYSGYYGMTSVDWDGAVMGYGSVQHIPAHSYEVRAQVGRQRPVIIGNFIEETTVSGEVDTMTTERFFLNYSAPGQSVVGVATGGIEALTTVYDHYFGPLHRLAKTEGERFVWRSFEGEPALFGIRDSFGQAGSFDLHLKTLTIEDLGSAVVGETTSLSATIPAGSASVFGTIRLESPGMASVEIHADPGLSVTVRDADLSRHRGPLMLPTDFDKAGNEDGVFVELSTKDGAPVYEDTAVHLDVTLAPPIQHRSSLGLSDSMLLEPPVAAQGTLRHYSEAHWFSFEVEAPSRITSSVLPRAGSRGVVTAMSIVNRFGQELSGDFHSGPGNYSAIDHVIEQPGTYYLGVAANTEAPFHYLLELRSEVQ